MAKLAILVGCCYPDDPDPNLRLEGCYNDVETMKELLTTRCGFPPKKVVVLTDKPDSPLLPTGGIIRSAIDWMIEQAKAGDVLLFYFAGHGSFRDFGKGWGCIREEAIVPCDREPIFSAHFREMVNRIPQGAHLTIIADSCNSGGLIEMLKQQVGPRFPPHVCYTPRPYDYNPLYKPRLMPMTAIVRHLESRSRRLRHIYANDVSIKFRGQADHHAQVNASHQPVDQLDDKGILISACQSDESSFDSRGAIRGVRHPHGVFTAVLSESVKEEPGPISYKLLVEKCRAKIGLFVEKYRPNMERPPHPCLYCSDENVNAPFLQNR
ncbi:metacaspase-5-like [Coffea eugenioides]|uniref:metacaspase-5-like n=1 Tax=Coffea eugenioides TaxID=49369 RepID=UPI000F6122B4|nr:metacaspase-5-like [Coffea eugenioides]